MRFLLLKVEIKWKSLILNRAWNKWDVYLDEAAWMEHHILMTNLDDGKLSLDPSHWCKISLLNLVMSNNFGYFNMDC